MAQQQITIMVSVFNDEYFEESSKLQNEFIDSMVTHITEFDSDISEDDIMITFDIISDSDES